MATQLQIRRGTSTQVAAFTGAEGEIVVNTTNDSVHVNDGSTAGGFEMARADLNNVSDTSLNAALTGNTVSALTITTLTLGSTAITATGTELNYVDGVTSAIQTQIDTKAPLASPTFTGTVTGVNATFTTADNSDNLTLTSTDADANAGPNLRMYRNSGSPADSDAIGLIDFEGRNDNSQDVVYAAIDTRIVDASDGTEDGRLEIATILTGTAGVSRILMDATETVINDNSKDLDFRVESDGNANMLFVDGGNNRIGIAAVPTDGTLHIQTASAGTVAASSQADDLVIENSAEGGMTIITPDDQSARIRFTSPSTNNDVGGATIFYRQNINKMLVGTAVSGGKLALASGAGNETMLLDSSGAVGIGATLVDANIKLQLEESDTTPVFLKTKNSAGSLIVGNNSAGNSYVSSQTSGKPLIFETQNTERMRIGSLGIITSLPTWNNGSASSANMVVNSSGVFLRAISSGKYKTDVEDVQDSYVDSLLQIRPVYYRSILENDNPKHSHWGFIAEEVAEIDPRLVHYKTVDVSYGDNGELVETELETPEPEGVQYDRFAPLMLKLIQKQQATITALEARITQLENN